MSFSMKQLRWGATVATGVSVSSLFILGNTVLALTTSHYCVILFEVPFTDKSFRLPDWAWGPIPFSICALSAITAVALWVGAGVRYIRRRVLENRIERTIAQG